MRRDYERRRHVEYLTGLIASAVANWSMGRPEKSLRPHDFALPLLQVPEKRPRMNRKKIAEKVRSVLSAALAAQNGKNRSPGAQ